MKTTLDDGSVKKKRLPWREWWETLTPEQRYKRKGIRAINVKPFYHKDSSPVKVYTKEEIEEYCRKKGIS